MRQIGFLVSCALILSIGGSSAWAANKAKESKVCYPESGAQREMAVSSYFLCGGGFGPAPLQLISQACFVFDEGGALKGISFLEFHHSADKDCDSNYPQKQWDWITPQDLADSGYKVAKDSNGRYFLDGKSQASFDVLMEYPGDDVEGDKQWMTVNMGLYALHVIVERAMGRRLGDVSKKIAPSVEQTRQSVGF